jgi:A/G-specific adenine glycosylase
VPAPRQNRNAPLSAVSSSPVRRAFHHNLIIWFQKHARDLPWRKANGRDPYAVAVSEFMLQQTQVATVIPYFERWMNVFPTWKALAAAPEARVLKQWEGLGYYRRARNLQALARAVMEKHAGQLPANVGELRALPGIGPYTAGAIGSFAFGLNTPLVDGNVQRVFARVFDLAWDLAQPAVQKAFWELAASLMPKSQREARNSKPKEKASPSSLELQTSNSALYNEALMELGATVCLPRKPLCLLCPLENICRGKGHAEDLPVKTRVKIIGETEQRAILQKNGKIWMLDPGQPGRWRGFHRLPQFDPKTMTKQKALGDLAYTITNHRVKTMLFEAGWKGKAPTHGTWLAREELQALALPSPHRKMLAFV